MSSEELDKEIEELIINYMVNQSTPEVIDAIKALIDKRERAAWEAARATYRAEYVTENNTRGTYSEKTYPTIDDWKKARGK